MPMAVAVWLFSRAGFGAFRRMQEQIEHLHQVAQVQAVERERQQIAREMNDGLAQVLSFVNTKAQAAEFFEAIEAVEHGESVIPSRLRASSGQGSSD